VVETGCGVFVCVCGFDIAKVTTVFKKMALELKLALYGAVSVTRISKKKKKSFTVRQGYPKH